MKTRPATALLKATLVLGLGLSVSCGGLSRTGDGQLDPERREALMREFQETLTGVALVGHFTTGEGRLREERYDIEGVRHLSGDYWLVQARVRYGRRDVTLPVPLQVKWAGDTPVLTLTDLTLPGLGTFTARVLIHRDQYVGTWSSGDHGGQMFGHIERTP